MIRLNPWYLPTLDLTFIFIAKNATNSLTRAMRHLPVQEIKDRNNLPSNYFVMWRDPIKRMESAWRMYQGPRQGFDGSFEDMVELACGDHDDPHLATQVSYLPSNGAGEILRWDFDRFQEITGCEKIGHYNAAPQVECKWTPALLYKFRKTFSDDFDIWEGK